MSWCGFDGEIVEIFLSSGGDTWSYGNYKGKLQHAQITPHHVLPSQNAQVKVKGKTSGKVALSEPFHLTVPPLRRV